MCLSGLLTTHQAAYPQQQSFKTAQDTFSNTARAIHYPQAKPKAVILRLVLIESTRRNHSTTGNNNKKLPQLAQTNFA
jgi:hypothetical protein